MPDTLGCNVGSPPTRLNLSIARLRPRFKAWFNNDSSITSEISEVQRSRREIPTQQPGHRKLQERATSIVSVVSGRVNNLLRNSLVSSGVKIFELAIVMRSTSTISFLFSRLFLHSAVRRAATAPECGNNFLSQFNFREYVARNHLVIVIHSSRPFIELL